MKSASKQYSTMHPQHDHNSTLPIIPEPLCPPTDNTDTPTRQSSASNIFSSQNQVYYYSKFELFEAEQQYELQFYQYSSFIDRVQMELGREWRRQADALFAPFCSSKCVFMNLLTIWLRHHPNVNKVKGKAIFSQVYVDQFVTKMREDILDGRYKNIIKLNKKINDTIKSEHQQFGMPNPGSTSIKAVCMGFFMTSNEIWEEMFQQSSQEGQRSAQMQNTTTTTTTTTKNGFTFSPFSSFQRFSTSNNVTNQANQNQRSFFSANSLIAGVASTLQMTFKPLMVVTEKISSVFGRKKRKMNQPPTQPYKPISPQPKPKPKPKPIIESQLQHPPIINQINQNPNCDQSSFQNCYYEFRRTLGIQKHLQRKMSQFNLEDPLPPIPPQPIPQSTIITRKSFQVSQSPVQASLLSNLYNYVTGFLNRNYSWQVASNFVTQILDLNTVRMDNGMKVKVLRPAEDFYQKLVIIWLLFKNQQSKEQQDKRLNINIKEIKTSKNNDISQGNLCGMTFSIYLARLKSTYFQNNWRDKYIVPCKYFYEKMTDNWTAIKSECSQLTDEKQIMRAFIRRIRNSMKEDWDRKISLNTKSTSSKSSSQKDSNKKKKPKKSPSQQKISKDIDIDIQSSDEHNRQEQVSQHTIVLNRRILKKQFSEATE